MATLTVSNISSSGVADVTTPLVAADAAGDDVLASSGLLVMVSNGDASSHTLTVTRPSATVSVAGYGDLPLSDLTLTVAAGDVGAITIPSKYAANGSFSWTYDAATSVSVGVFSIAP